MCILEYTRIS